MKMLLKIFGAISIVIALHILINISGVLPFFDFRFYDVLSRVETVELTPESSSTVVVEIDEQSLKDLGQWPWSRIVLAQVIQEIVAQRPAAVGLDILFPEPDRTSPKQVSEFYRNILGLDVELSGFPPVLADHDLIFAQALSSGPTVLPLFITAGHQGVASCALPLGSLLSIPEGVDIPQRQSILCNTPVLQQSVQGVGFINAAIDVDGIFRRHSMLIGSSGGAYMSLSLAMLAQLDPDITIEAPTARCQPLTIHVAGVQIETNRKAEILNPLFGRDSFKRVSVSDLLKGNCPANLFTGKMVLIGATAVGLFDQFITSGGEVLPGVFTHASLLENIFQGNCLYQLEQTKHLALFLSAVFSFLIIWLVLKRHYLLSAIAYFSIALCSTLLTWVMIKQGVYLSLGYFLVPFSSFYFILSLLFSISHYVVRKRFLEDLGEAHSATIDSMTMVAESRDVETGAHIVRTKKYVRLLAQTLLDTGHYQDELNAYVIELLYRAAPLHDIGKVGISDAILQKPDKLTEPEFVIMKTHAQIGHTVIQNAIRSYNKTNEFLTIAANISYGHHERWDGSGYPQGLKGLDIPLSARLMALADVYDALISKRCYKEAFSFELAEKIIHEGRGNHFDPTIVDVFGQLHAEFRNIALIENGTLENEKEQSSVA